MAYSKRAVGIDELKEEAPYFFGGNNRHGSPVLFISDRRAMPVQFYHGNGHKHRKNEIPPSNQNGTGITSQVYQALSKVYFNDVSTGREALLSICQRSLKNKRRRHPSTAVPPSKKAETLRSELKVMSLDYVIEKAGL